MKCGFCGKEYSFWKWLDVGAYCDRICRKAVGIRQQDKYNELRAEEERLVRERYTRVINFNKQRENDNKRR